MNGENRWTRRAFAKGILASTALLHTSFKSQEKNERFDLMKEVFRLKKLDAYTTSVFTPASIALLLDYDDRCGVSKMIRDYPVTQTKLTKDEIREHNNKFIAAVKPPPDRFVGQFTVNPLYSRQSLEDNERCLD